MDDKEIIRMARKELKGKMVNGEIWPFTRCACGKWGATHLGHIVYTRHPDRAELYHEYNCTMLCADCNTTGERLWMNVNACLILLQRAGGVVNWIRWAQELPRKERFHIPQKMDIAMGLWYQGVRPFDLERVRSTVENL